MIYIVLVIDINYGEVYEKYLFHTKEESTKKWEEMTDDENGQDMWSGNDLRFLHYAIDTTTLDETHFAERRWEKIDGCWN